MCALIPNWLRARPQELAIDFHDQPCYGCHNRGDPDNWARRKEARAGTARFYRGATAYVLLRDIRLAVAVVLVFNICDLLRLCKV